MKKAFSSLMSLVLALGIGFLAVLAPPIAPMDMASAADTTGYVCLKSLGPGTTLFIPSREWAGQFNMSVDGVPYKGWCIDTVNPIGVGWCFNATLSDAPREMPWCEIGHILTNYSATSNTEAAAMQLAFWKYFYPGLAAIYPTEVENRALVIFSEAAGRSVIGPDSALSLTPHDGVVVNGGGTASQEFTATVTDPGCLAGIPIDFSLNFSTGTGSFSPNSALTDSAGEASVTVSWDASQSSYEFTITAHTEGEWPVIIEPQELSPKGKPIQKTIISEPYELIADEGMAGQQEVGCLEVTKEADTEISKEGDTITYTIEVCNTGELDLTKTSITDTLLPDINDAFGPTLTAGNCESHTFTYKVPEGAPNPLVNEVTATYEDEAGTAVSDTATKSVPLVYPDIEVTKTASPALGVVGDTITYTIEVENTGDVELVLDSVSDSLLGSLAGFSSTLGAGDSESKDFTRKIQSGDPNPLVNTVTVHYHVEGLPNDITDEDSAMVCLMQCGARIIGAKFYNRCCGDDSWNHSLEIGIPGWKIYLKQGGSTIAETETDAAGYFVFENVLAGAYTMEEKLDIPGWEYCTTGELQTSYEVIVTPWDEHTGATVGVDKDGRKLWFANKIIDEGSDWHKVEVTIAGSKFDDLSGDGNRDAGEPGIQGWRIELQQRSWPYTLQDHTFTGVNGNYTFDRYLPPGAYMVYEAAQVDWQATTPTRQFVFITKYDDGETFNVPSFGNVESKSGGGMTFSASSYYAGFATSENEDGGCSSTP